MTRRLLTAGLVIAFVISVVVDPGSLLLIPLVFVLVVPFEKLFPRHRQPIRRKDLRTDLGYAALRPVLTAVGLTVGILIALVSFAWLPGLVLSPLVALAPEWLLFVSGILLFDLVVYWIHRLSHEIPLLWRFHAVHHSPERLDWVSGFRAHPFDGIILAPAVVFLLAAGFSAEFTGALLAIQIFVGLFLHSNVRWRWRPLHRIIITPEFHHWHHSNEPGGLNSNYSSLLPLWDMLFSSYFMPADRRPQIYGINEHMPERLTDQLRYPLRGLPTLRWTLRHPIQATRRTWRALGRGIPAVWQAVSHPRSPMRPPAAVERELQSTF